MDKTRKQTGTLFILPNTLGNTPENNTIPEYVLNIIRSLDVFVVENVKSAAGYLRWIDHPVPEYERDYFLLDKKTSRKETASFLKPLIEGRDVGIISEAGCPVVADPGSILIDMAHSRGIEVKPLVGPSSILLALMGSGFNGQSFCFHGYLPRNEKKRERYIQQLESESQKVNRTQLFMETPYRNEELVVSVMNVCNPPTKLCIASNLTLPNEKIISRSISSWKKQTLPSLQKKPAIFLLYAGSA